LWRRSWDSIPRNLRVTTAADIDNVAVAAEMNDNVTVTAAVTGGSTRTAAGGARPAGTSRRHQLCRRQTFQPVLRNHNILLFVSTASRGCDHPALVPCTRRKRGLQSCWRASHIPPALPPAPARTHDHRVRLGHPFPNYAGKHSMLGN
jgi:hypothetical protein